MFRGQRGPSVTGPEPDPGGCQPEPAPGVPSNGGRNPVRELNRDVVLVANAHDLPGYLRFRGTFGLFRGRQPELSRWRRGVLGPCRGPQDHRLGRPTGRSGYHRPPDRLGCRRGGDREIPGRHHHRNREGPRHVQGRDHASLVGLAGDRPSQGAGAAEPLRGTQVRRARRRPGVGAGRSGRSSGGRRVRPHTGVVEPALHGLGRGRKEAAHGLGGGRSGRLDRDSIGCPSTRRSPP